MLSVICGGPWVQTLSLEWLLGACCESDLEQLVEGLVSCLYNVPSVQLVSAKRIDGITFLMLAHPHVTPDPHHIMYNVKPKFRGSGNAEKTKDLNAQIRARAQAK